MIHILYRHTNHSGFGKNRPHWFSYEKSLDNILSTIEGFDFVKFHLMFDGECNITDPRIHHTEIFKGGSDWASYCYTWNYAKNLDLKDNDIVYMAENDYAFVQGWPLKVIELFNAYGEIDYVTLYDHPDFYDSRSYPGLTSHILPAKTHHWKTVPSSTGSILMSKRIIMEDFDIHTSNPSDRGRFDYLSFYRGRNVLAPIPSLSTHCEVEWIAPVIEWEKIYTK